MCFAAVYMYLICISIADQPSLQFVVLLTRLHVCHEQKERSASKHNFFKRTKHGQPLMKYRVDKVLQVLQREVAGKP